MTNLPRLELTEEPNNKNDFIIFRHGSNTKHVTKKNINKKKGTGKKKNKRVRRTMKKRKTRKSRKGFFNIF